LTRFEFVRSRLLAPAPPLIVALPLALPFILAPTLVRWVVDGVITGTTFVPYFPFVLLAAVFLGSRAAGVVMLVSAPVANFLFMEPRYTLFANAGDTLGAMFFVIASSLIIALTDSLRRTLRQVETGARREADLNVELQHLNSELQHRVKNMLTVVQGLAGQTFRGSPANDEAVRTFRGRLQALSEAQDVLTSGRSESCRLPDLALRALAPFNEQGALCIDGPPCTLPEEACVPLVLALHELGTNALKYGALSTRTGSVDLVWTTAETPSGKREVALAWTEKEGPVVAPPTRKGLGSRLLKPQRGLDDVTLEFRPKGLKCTIVVAHAAAVP